MPSDYLWTDSGIKNINMFQITFKLVVLGGDKNALVYYYLENESQLL